MGAAITAFEDFLIVPSFWPDWCREKVEAKPLNLSEMQRVGRLQHRHRPGKVHNGKGTEAQSRTFSFLSSCLSPSVPPRLCRV